MLDELDEDEEEMKTSRKNAQAVVKIVKATRGAERLACIIDPRSSKWLPVRTRLAAI